MGMFHGDLSRLVVLVVCLELGLLQSDRSSYESVEHCRTSQENVGKCSLESGHHYTYYTLRHVAGRVWSGPSQCL